MRRHGSRKMIILLAVALLTAALLSACGKKPRDRDEDAKSGKAAEEEYTGPRKYSFNTYYIREDGTREHTDYDAYEMDEKGHKIRWEYARGADLQRKGQRRWLYDELGRVVYWEATQWVENTEIRFLTYGLLAYDGDSDRIVYQEQHGDGSSDDVEITERQYDAYGNLIFERATDLLTDGYRIQVDSDIQGTKRRVYKYADTPDEYGEKVVVETFCYDEEGRLLWEDEHCPVYSYTDDGVEYLKPGNHVRKLYEYDEDGRCVGTASYDQSYDPDNPYEKEEFEYHNNGKIAEYRRYTAVNSVWCLTHSDEYDEQERLCRSTENFLDGTLNSLTQVEWDIDDPTVPNRKVNRESVYDLYNGVQVLTSETYYLGDIDDYNSMYRMRERVIDWNMGTGSGGPSLSEEMRLGLDTEFDKDGKPVKQTAYNRYDRCDVREYDTMGNVVREYSLENNEIVPGSEWIYEYTYE